VEIERESTISHTEYDSIWNRLWICRKTDYGMHQNNHKMAPYRHVTNIFFQILFQPAYIAVLGLFKVRRKQFDLFNPMSTSRSSKCIGQMTEQGAAAILLCISHTPLTFRFDRIKSLATKSHWYRSVRGRTAIRLVSWYFFPVN
jgi:hypothetical protein